MIAERCVAVSAAMTQAESNIQSHMTKQILKGIDGSKRAIEGLDLLITNKAHVRSQPTADCSFQWRQRHGCICCM